MPSLQLLEFGLFHGKYECFDEVRGSFRTINHVLFLKDHTGWIENRASRSKSQEAPRLLTPQLIQVDGYCPILNSLTMVIWMAMSQWRVSFFGLYIFFSQLFTSTYRSCVRMTTDYLQNLLKYIRGAQPIWVWFRGQVPSKIYILDFAKWDRGFKLGSAVIAVFQSCGFVSLASYSLLLKLFVTVIMAQTKSTKASPLPSPSTLLRAKIVITKAAQG